MRATNNGLSQAYSLTKQGIFSTSDSPVKTDYSWEMICSTWWSTVFINRSNNKLLGLGKKHVSKITYGPDPEVVWSIPLRMNLRIKQIAVGLSHFLILYENGLLESYGNGNSGQLGVGYFRNDDGKTLQIVLPDDEIAHSVYAGEYHSLVVSKTGKLYGFGTNLNGQLGINNEGNSVAFPTAVALPEGSVVSEVYTGNDRTIVVCDNGAIYGFGANYSSEFGNNSLENTCYLPIRLKHFEDMQAKSFVMAEGMVILLTHHGKCYYYGVNIAAQLPVNYETHEIYLPTGVKAKTISQRYKHLIVVSEENDVWINDSSHNRFLQLKHPNDKKIKSASAGYLSAVIFDEDNNCFVWGENQDAKLGLDINIKYCNQLTPLALNDLCHLAAFKSLSGSISTPTPSPSQNFSYSDSSELLDLIMQDPSPTIEIQRPPGSGKSVALHSLYQLLMSKTIPVILLDFNDVKHDDYYAFENSFNQIVASLYVKYRRVLFNGILNNQPLVQERYQKLALEGRDYYSRKNSLHELIELLAKQYNQPVFLLLDHADRYFRSCTSVDSCRVMENNFIKLLTGLPQATKTILMTVHPTKLADSENSLKRSHGLLDRDSPYLKHISRPAIIRPDEKNLLLETLRMSPELCELIGDILAGKPCQYTIRPQHPLSVLIREGLLQATFADNHSPTLLLSAPAGVALTKLQALHRRWQIQNMNRVTVVFDIDEVLATHDSCHANTAHYFLKKSAIIYACNYTHYIVPGALELMQLLFARDDVQMAFFSAGHQDRNTTFVRDLLVRAIGETRYVQLAAAKVKILSGPDIKVERSTSRRIKDIRDALAPEDALDNAIFVDNNATHVVMEQTQQYLQAETVLSEHFDQLGKPDAACDSAQDELFRKVNNIFHLTSVINHHILHRNEKSFANQLAAEPTTESYQDGLQLLQQFNPALTFNTPASYKECVTLKRTVSQEFNVNQAKLHEYYMDRTSFNI